jgi:alkylhydroperoxidase family enzyme
VLGRTRWRRATQPLYTDTELLPETRAPDDVFEELRRHFSEEDIVKLATMIGMINLWNRFGVGFRLVPSALSAKASAAQ